MRKRDKSVPSVIWDQFIQTAHQIRSDHLTSSGSDVWSLSFLMSFPQKFIPMCSMVVVSRHQPQPQPENEVIVYQSVSSPKRGVVVTLIRL